MAEEINELFPIHINKQKFICNVHEDNQSCIKMVTKKYLPENSTLP